MIEGQELVERTISPTFCLRPTKKGKFCHRHKSVYFSLLQRLTQFLQYPLFLKPPAGPQRTTGGLQTTVCETLSYSLGGKWKDFHAVTSHNSKTDAMIFTKFSSGYQGGQCKEDILVEYWDWPLVS
jgi:hypothetical protein